MFKEEIEIRRSLDAAMTRASNLQIAAAAAGREMTRGEAQAFGVAVDAATQLNANLDAYRGVGPTNVNGTPVHAGGSPGDGLRDLAASWAGQANSTRGGEPSPPGSHPMPTGVERAVVEQLWDHFRSGRVEAVEVEPVRAIIAPPQSTISDYRPTLTFERRYDQLRVADLMVMDTTTQASVTYYSETTGSSAAAPVAEGALKPESSAVWTPVTTQVRKIAHFTDPSKESLDDFAGFQQLVTRSLMSGLLSAENSQLLTGDGTGINLLGLVNAAGILTYAPATAEARILSVRRAITVLQQGSSFDLQPTALLINPLDWEKIQTTLAAGSGEFLDDGAAATGMTPAGQPTIWGVPVGITNRMTVGTMLLGNFPDASMCWMRERPSIFIDPYSQSASNKVRMICEERLALGVVRAPAMVKITANGTT